MRIPLLCLSLLSCSAPAQAQAPFSIPRPDREIPLCAGKAPGSEDWNWPERQRTLSGLDFVQKVVRPVLLYYAADPAKASGTAVIVAPGGGSVNLTILYEGTDVARRLNAVGVAAFVLKYRLIRHDPATSRADPRDKRGEVLSGPQQGQNILDLEADDGRQAVRLIRLHTADFGVNPHRIGFVGFSAGGRICLETLDGPAECRPDFIAPIYGAGDGRYRPLRDGPPMFLAVAADDDGNVEGSVRLFTRWNEAELPAEIHVFQTGGHGFLKRGGGGDHVIDRFIEWMQGNGWVARAAR
jgi:acetyl esterase/lipase